MKPRRPSPELRTVLAYALLSGAWILGSDRLMFALVHDPAQIARVGLFKGWGFVLASSTLIYAQLRIDRAARRRAEAALRESERNYREIFESANDAIFIHDAETGDILDVNEAVLRLFGYDRSEAIVAPFDADRLGESPYSEAEVRGWMTRALREGPQRFEWRARRKSGEMFWVEIDLKVAEIGGRRRLLAMVRDIGDRKRAEEELRRHRERLAGAGRALALGELSTAMAHELNQPLAAILSNAQAARRLLSQAPPDLEEVRQALADIERDDGRAGEIIRRLRDFVRRQQPVRRTLDLNRLGREVLQLVQPEAVLREVMTVSRFDPDLAPVHGDPVALQQVLMNLLMNALDALRQVPPSERQLALVTRRAGNDAVEILVRDTGPGVAPELLERLFEPFYTTKPDGLGLGLPLSRSLVEAHGGAVWAERNPSGGMTFGLRLPAATGGGT